MRNLKLTVTLNTSRNKRIVIDPNPNPNPNRIIFARNVTGRIMRNVKLLLTLTLTLNLTLIGEKCYEMEYYY